MKDTEIIEKYFNGLLNKEEKSLFEERLRQDDALRQDVAYYIQLQEALAQEQLATRHAEWRKAVKPKTISFKSLFSMAAALVLVVGGIWYWTLQPSIDLEKQANRYIQEHLQERNIQMSASKDSLQQAIELFNLGDLQASSALVEQLVQHNPTNAEYLELAGITALRLEHYEKALAHFRLMEKLDLYDNPAVFYQAVTLLQRKDSLDLQEAEKLLKKVIQEQLGGKNYAQEWLTNP